MALPLAALSLASLALASPSAIPVLPKSGEGWVDRLASMDLRWPVAPVAALQSPDELGVPPGQRNPVADGRVRGPLDVLIWSRILCSPRLKSSLMIFALRFMI